MAVFNGTSGPDSFVPPTGTSTISGSGGIDTVSSNFRLIDATFRWVGNQAIIDTPTSQPTPAGIDFFQCDTSAAPSRLRNKHQLSCSAASCG